MVPSFLDEPQSPPASNAQPNPLISNAAKLTQLCIYMCMYIYACTHAYMCVYIYTYMSMFQDNYIHPQTPNPKTLNPHRYVQANQHLALTNRAARAAGGRFWSAASARSSKKMICINVLLECHRITCCTSAGQQF